MKPGDLLIALPSSGPHANGFSLIRKLITERGVDLNAVAPFGGTWAETLLTPTRIYVDDLEPLLRDGSIKGMAHITGGGLMENVPRVLPDGLAPRYDQDALKLPPLFSWLKEAGNLQNDEIYTVFNCGIGMVLICGLGQSEAVLTACKDAFIIGELTRA